MGRFEITGLGRFQQTLVTCSCFIRNSIRVHLDFQIPQSLKMLLGVGSNLPEIATWVRFQPTLSWGRFQPTLSWGRFQPTLGWGRFQPTLSWGRFQAKLSWGRFQPTLSWGRFDLFLINCSCYRLDGIGLHFHFILPWSLTLQLGVGSNLPEIGTWGRFQPTLSWCRFHPTLCWGRFGPTMLTCSCCIWNRIRVHLDFQFP